jgi:hypothetical protein
MGHGVLETNIGLELEAKLENTVTHMGHGVLETNIGL